MSIVIKNIKKKYGNFIAVDDVSLHVDEGEFVALLGPSGSGKTTLLRIIAGLEMADEGDIYLQGVDASGTPIIDRKIGFVFQHFALFKHMTVFENIAFGLRLKRPKISEEEIKDRINELLSLVHLEGSGKKYPSMLSGGQRQRIALARVLAIQPKYMLLDEPFGALDTTVRKELRRWLRKLHDATGLTTVFVTHDQDEAMEVSDKIAILNQGKLMEVGSPVELWKNPTSSFVFNFLGNYNTFLGYQSSKNELILNQDFQDFLINDKNADETNADAKNLKNAKQIKAFSRPHETVLERDPVHKEFFYHVKLIMINQAGPLIKTELEDSTGVCYQVDLDAETFEDLNLKEGENLWMRPKIYKIFND